jgi:hypothetical protein
MWSQKACIEVVNNTGDSSTCVMESQVVEIYVAHSPEEKRKLNYIQSSSTTFMSN